MNNEQEKFKAELFQSLTDINEKLNQNKELTEQDYLTLLMSSVLEEES